MNRLSLNEPGVTAMSGGTSPVPLRGMLKAGASGSLLAIVSVPASGAATVGRNVTPTTRLCPGTKLKLATSALKSALSLPIPLTTSTSVPWFVTVSIFVSDAPMNREPKSSAAGDTAMSGAPVTCRCAGILTSASSGSLLDTTRSAS